MAQIYAAYKIIGYDYIPNINILSMHVNMLIFWYKHTRYSISLFCLFFMNSSAG